jgi:hypothetical protein
MGVVMDGVTNNGQYVNYGLVLAGVAIAVVALVLGFALKTQFFQTYGWAVAIGGSIVGAGIATLGVRNEMKRRGWGRWSGVGSGGATGAAAAPPGQTLVFTSSTDELVAAGAAQPGDRVEQPLLTSDTLPRVQESKEAFHIEPAY